jgi:hypothetical protein
MPRQARLDAPGNSGDTILLSSLQDGTPCTLRKPAPVGSLEGLYFSNQVDAPDAHRRVFDPAGPLCGNIPPYPIPCAGRTKRRCQ